MIKKLIMLLFLVMFSFPALAVDHNIIVGNPSAKAKMKLYYSMTCSACSKFHNTTLQEIQKEYISSGKASLEYVPYPLDYVSFAMEGFLACVPSEVAHKELLNTLLKDQKEWLYEEDKSSWIKKKLAFYMSSDEIKKCETNKESAIALKDRIDVYKQKRIVYMTPSLFLNGKRLDSLSYDFVKKAIEAELNK